jgi:uncharacterized damage-inducible protein DinB
MKANFRRMAAYNRWANARLYEAVGHLSPEEFAAPRSGFFPSLLKTLNHLLVGDTVWMSRLDGAGNHGISSLDQILHTDFAALRSARVALMIGSSHSSMAWRRHGSRRTWSIAPWPAIR